MITRQIHLHFILSALTICISLHAHAQWGSAAADSVINNDIDGYYNDPGKRNNQKFKSITRVIYSSKDTNFHKKTLVSKTKAVFDNTGKQVYTLVTDNKQRCVDSTLSMYDSRNNKTRQTDYIFDSLGKRSLYSDEVYTYNDQGRVLKDSMTESIEDVKFEGNDNLEMKKTGRFEITYSYNRYDKAGNLIWQLQVENEDTTITLSTYDDKNRAVENKTYNSGEWGIERMVYDKDGNITEHVEIESPGDTTITRSVYDARHRTVEERKFNNGTLGSFESNVYNSDSSRVNTKEEYEEDGNSCPNNNKAVTTYDTHYNQVSKITNSLKGGIPFTVKVLDKIQYENGRMVCDTETTEEDGNMYMSRSTMITNYKFNASGDLVYTEERGGGQYATNSKTIKAYNSHRLTTKIEEYNSCSDKPYSTNIVIFYPDDETIKEEIETDAEKKIINRYGKDSRKLEIIRIKSNGNNEKIEWEYQE